MPWARAGAGAIATQALANVRYGVDGLERLASGEEASVVVKELTDADSERRHRQLGIVDAAGSSATYTGDECFEWAGGRTGEGYCCQGNILVGARVIDDMARAFEAARGELAQRLLAALQAGDDAGGDRRGRQSASILIVQKGGGYLGGTDRAVDLRVDDHPAPVPELRRVFDLHRLYFPRPEALDFIDVDYALAQELRTLLSKLGYGVGERAEGYDDALKGALYAFAGTENLEERWSDEPKIERRVLDYVRERAGSALG